MIVLGCLTLLKTAQVIASKDEVISGAATTTPFSITVGNLEALKPTRIAITSIKPTNTGANVIAFTSQIAAISTLMRQMDQACWLS